MPKIYAVLVRQSDGKSESYTPVFQTEDQFAHAWKNVLTLARGDGSVITCTCPGTGNKKLAIRHYEDNDLFTLARYPLSGSEHARDCKFYSPDVKHSGLRDYCAKVITEGQNGVNIRLEIGLTKRTARAAVAAPAVASAPQQGVGRGSRPAMRLLGLLHYLWDEANLNAWWPAMQGKRSTGLVNRELDKTASSVMVGRINLNSVLLLPDPNQDGSWACKNRERVTSAITKKHRLIAIVPLAKHTAEQAKKMASQLKIFGFQGIPLMSMTSELWNATCCRFPRAIAAWEHQQPVLAIAMLDDIKPGKDRGHYAKVINLALMPVTKNWIPFDSMYEQKIADKLTAEGRGFIKPLRYDADESLVFPDFILQDMEKEIPLEVFGRSDETYIARQAEKIAYYEEVYGTGHWWCWNAAKDPEGQNIPPFPPSDRYGK
jgi:hypothetical protein